MEFQIKKVEKGDIDTEELKKQIPGWCSLLLMKKKNHLNY